MSGNNGSKPMIEPAPAEAQAAETQKLTMKGLKRELDDLANFIENDVLSKIIDLTNAAEAHDEAFRIVSTNEANLQQSIDILAGEAKVRQMGTPPPEPEPEPEPIPEPETDPDGIRFGKPRNVALEAIADSCIVMNDILLLCKAMKKVPELTDQDRIVLLDLAGRRAGIEIQPGMQVRAGVKMIVT